MFEKIENALGFGKIRETTEFVRQKALESLRDHLIRIGATPTSVNRTQDRFSGVIGTVTIANGNIDLVELERKVHGGYSSEGVWTNAEARYRCSYVMQAKVNVLEKKSEGTLAACRKRHHKQAVFRRA